LALRVLFSFALKLALELVLLKLAPGEAVPALVIPGIPIILLGCLSLCFLASISFPTLVPSTSLGTQSALLPSPTTLSDRPPALLYLIDDSLRLWAGLPAVAVSRLPPDAEDAEDAEDAVLSPRVPREPWLPLWCRVLCATRVLEL
jgi:hypothetical protein